MFLQGNFLGVTPLFGNISIIPPITSYDNFKFYGGVTGSIFSRIWGRNINKTAADFDEINNDNYVPSWDVGMNTYMLSRFENSLGAGNIDDIAGEVRSWKLFRKEVGTNILEFLAILDTNTVQYYDFTVLNNKEYEYRIFAQDDISISSAILTDPMTSDYYGWFLIDAEMNRAYQFDIDFAGGERNHIKEYNEFKTNNKVNAFTVGKNYYIEGSISAIISKDNEKKDLKYTNEDLISLAEFIRSDRPKILKSRRRQLHNVFTYGYQETLINSALGENIYVSSFNFKEVGDI